jgi:hypothetical protein
MKKIIAIISALIVGGLSLAIVAMPQLAEARLSAN